MGDRDRKLTALRRLDDAVLGRPGTRKATVTGLALGLAFVLPGLAALVTGVLAASVGSAVTGLVVIVLGCVAIAGSGLRR